MAYLFYFLILVSNAALWSSPLHAQGIYFEHSALTQALNKARAEQKMVFVDAYTSWCGPCKMMATQTFQDSAVAAYYNTRFVPLKIDMETGEGPLLAKRYAVQFYPTLLFLYPNGDLAHKAVGFYGPAQFLALGQRATNHTANLYALSTRYQLGDHDPNLLLALTQVLSDANDPTTAQVAAEYFETQTDLHTPENIEAIFRFANDPYAEAFKFLMKNRLEFESRYSAEKVGQKVDAVFEEYLHNHPDLQLGEVQRLYGACYPEQGERLASNYRLAYYQQRNDMKRFALAAVDHYNRFPTDDADELNEIASLFAQNVTDPVMLQRAVVWSQKAVRLQENTTNQMTLATLFLKLGKKKAADKTAHQALILAKSAGEDYSEIDAFLKGL